ncbi:CDP-diacylglycerol--glycerol-3-phosphate 3-phosphatidyltransferase [Candidatus Woesearchaeota archaeon]|nr:CDP-diacylglycerol--glycerol-3-phosphate 3-phosphatidyltransferase [Candidatus Woesearchaeota archaeon]
MKDFPMLNITLPNKITLLRVLLIPIFAWLFFSGIAYQEFWAAAVFIILLSSDFLDGYLARKRNQETDFGRIMDPIADKMVIVAALLLLVDKGIPLWMALAIIVRETILTAVRLILLSRHIVVPAGPLGKAKTPFQSIGIVMVLLGIPGSWWVMLFATFLTLISGISYLYQIRKKTYNDIVNVPNLITLARFLLIIPFSYYFIRGEIALSITLFGVISLSDKLDGLSARLMNQMTEIGSAFDSLTDWSLVFSSFALLVLSGKLPLIWLIAIAVPALIDGICKLAYARRRKKVPVTMIARIGVSVTYAALFTMFIQFTYSWHILTAAVLIQYLVMAVYLYKVFFHNEMAVGVKPRSLERLLSLKMRT